MNIAELAATQQRYWFGTADLPGEVTEHSALRITPEVEPARGRDTSRRLRFTGYWMLIHVPTGYEISAEHWLPIQWLRRFAILLAESTIDWDQLSGDTRMVGHPQHTVIRDLGRTVLDCWARGIPLAELEESLIIEAGQFHLVCANPRCEDDMFSGGWRAPLTGAGEDGQDVIAVEPADLDELRDAARYFGWRELDEHRDQHTWLCEACAMKYEPAPAHTARRFPQPDTARAL